MKKNCWVYIVKNEKGDIVIGFSVDMDKKFTEISMRKERLFYLHPFEKPFDGLAHKHLLDSLSEDTISHIVQHHHEQTETYKHALSSLQNSHYLQW